MTALLALAKWKARAQLAKWAINLLRIAGCMVFMLAWGCTSGQQGVMIEEMQPGGRARLRAPSDIVLNGGGTDLGGNPLPGTPGFIGPVQGSTILPPPPQAQWIAMVGAAASAPCAFPGPVLLAAIAFYESDYGANLGPSPAGARGYGQFMPATFTEYHVPVSDANDYRVMLPAMVAKLCHDGVATSVDRALLAYNDSQAYVSHIEALVASWGTTGARTWQDLPAYNQFDPRNWASQANFNTWSAAACSAASVDWLLSAYGQPPGSIDAALALIGPNSNISAHVGLLNANESALAAALSRAGLASWNEHLSQAQLVAKLQQGPAILDGAAWFGVGHVFVATGSDAGGIAVRESSGNNIRYVTWNQLASTVGWNGWAVGVTPTQPSSSQA